MGTPTYQNAQGKDWNTYIKNKGAELEAQGKKVSYYTDDNNQLHYSTKGLDAAKKIANNYSAGTTQYITNKGDVYSLYEEPKLDYSAIMGMLSSYGQQQQQAYDNAQKATDEQINNQADKSARDYYVLYKKQSAALPTQLSRVGATGGASETSQVALLNNYGTNIANNENLRNNNLSSSAITANTNKAKASQEVASQMANYYYQMAMQQAQDEKDAKDKLEAERTLNTVNSWNSQISNSIKEQLDKGKTVYTWTSNDGKNHWTTSKNTAMASGYSYSTLSPSKPKTPPGPDDGGSNIGDKIITQINTYLQRVPAGITQAQLATVVNNILSEYTLDDATKKYVLNNYNL